MNAYWIDTHEFHTFGGWTLETQFTHRIGASYLMAAGAGTPVECARHQVEIRRRGDYRLWVLSKDWYPDYSPGAFTLEVHNYRSSLLIAPKKTYGIQAEDGWTWEDGSVVHLENECLMLTLRDLSGYYGRCAAILLTDDLEYRPPIAPDQIIDTRLVIKGETGYPIRHEETFDLIVAGGGIAGSCAALSAARLGMSVAFIQDRPMLGGNGSDEGQVSLNGAAVRFPYARESGIVGEIADLRNHQYRNAWTASIEALVGREQNIHLFSGQRVVDVTMEDETRIAGVKTIDTRTGLPSEFTAERFVDATGDGWLGVFAGASYMYGRESHHTYGESLAPEAADEVTMSGCLLGKNCGGLTGYHAEERTTPQGFVPPPWAYKLPSAGELHRGIVTIESGNWWLENDGSNDEVGHPEEARDDLIRLSFGYWDFIKNTWSEKTRAANWALVTIPTVNGRREGYRLMGDHVLTQRDVETSTRFPDRVSYGGWPIDLHHPKGVYSGSEGPFQSNAPVADYTIPYRCLYSKDIENLFVAGRAISVSHVALGTVRVQATLGALAQATATAAYLAKKHGTTNRGVYERHVEELQQTLLRSDQYILDVRNTDPDDLALCASVEASSIQNDIVFESTDTRRMKDLQAEADPSLVVDLNAVDGDLESILLFAGLEQGSGICALFYEYDGEKLGRLAGRVAVTASRTGETWFEFAVPPGISAQHLAVLFEPESRATFYCMDNVADGLRRIRRRDAARLELTDDGLLACATKPGIRQSRDNSAANVTNGIARPVGRMSNMWQSGPLAAGPQHITLSWDRTQTFDEIRLTFDTDCNSPRIGRFQGHSSSPYCVRDYRLEYTDGSIWKPLHEERGNFRRHRIHRFDPVTTDKIRLTAIATNGHPYARLFEMRVYGRA